MENREKEQYLLGDQDLLEKLETTDFDTSGLALEKRKAIISKIEIKAILRSRKQAADNDKSNKRFTIMLGAFALLQIIIAGFQFVIEMTNSENKIMAGFVAVIFLIVIYLFTREIDKILRDK